MEMRKLYCVENIKDLDVASVEKLCGFIKRIEVGWRVTCLDEELTFMDFASQENAEIFANTEMIKGMLLKRK